MGLIHAIKLSKLVKNIKKKTPASHNPIPWMGPMTTAGRRKTRSICRRLGAFFRRQWDEDAGSPLVALILFVVSVFLVGLFLQRRDTRSKQKQSGKKGGTCHCGPHPSGQARGGDDEYTPPAHGFAEIIGMPGVFPEALLHPSIPVFRSVFEPELLKIRYPFEGEAEKPKKITIKAS